MHTLWLYELLKSPTALTAAQLAAKSNIDRSLVSREVKILIDNGYISLAEGAKQRGYNTRLHLTERGREIAEKIARSALTVQESVGGCISADELAVFYNVLSRISENLEQLSRDGIADADGKNAVGE